MHPEPNTPPPLPTTPPSIPQTPPKKGTQPWVIAIILGAVLLVLIAVVGIGAAIMIPTVGKVRETARRTIDSANLRQVAQASLIYASDKNGRLPSHSIPPDGRSEGDRELATIHTVAAALARDGALNDAAVWFSSSDEATAGFDVLSRTVPIVLEDGSLNPEFMRQKSVSWDFVTGLNTNLPPNTPVAWTRGLRRDGTWDPRGGVYGDDGGHIVFLLGNVSFFPDLRHAPLVTPDGQPTSDILKALPVGTRVVGAGPGTLHGAEGGTR